MKAHQLSLINCFRLCELQSLLHAVNAASHSDIYDSPGHLCN